MEAVAKHLRSKVPCKSAVIKGRKVEYFVSEFPTWGSVYPRAWVPSTYVHCTPTLYNQQYALLCIYVGCKAVDCLMESKWTKMPEVDDHITPYFAARTDAAKYLVL